MAFWTLIFIGGCALVPTVGGYAIEALGYRGAYAFVCAAGLTGAGLFAVLGPRAAPVPAAGASPAQESESAGI